MKSHHLPSPQVRTHILQAADCIKEKGITMNHWYAFNMFSTNTF